MCGRPSEIESKASCDEKLLKFPRFSLRKVINRAKLRVHGKLSRTFFLVL